MTSILAFTLSTGCRTVTTEASFQRFQFAEPRMGTLFAITLYAPDREMAEQVADAAFARVAELNRVMSDYDPNSELMQLCRRPVGEPTRASRDLFTVLERAEKISRRTQGAFDVTIGPLVQLWRASRTNGQLPAMETIALAKIGVGHENLRLDSRDKTVTLLAPDMRLDLGGIGKGYAADEALKTMRRLGIRHALVAASGDLAIGDPPPGKDGWVIGVGAPDGGTKDLVRQVVLRNCGVSTSGDTEQFVEINGVRYSHIVNPATGLGLTERIQVTIIAQDTTESDGLATAVAILGVERGLALIESMPGAAALISQPSGGSTEAILSRRFPLK